MNVRFDASMEGRRVLLKEGGEVVAALPLDGGGNRRLVVGDLGRAKAVVAALEECPGTGILGAWGSLPGAMTVAESLALALRYEQDQVDAKDDEREMEYALQLCGFEGERLALLGNRQPMHLSRVDRWAIGLARWLLRPPELLVIDRLFAGVTRREAESLIAVQAAYHRRHPFRSVLFVDLDSHELPALPACRGLIQLGEEACHS